MEAQVYDITSHLQAWTDSRKLEINLWLNKVQGWQQILQQEQGMISSTETSVRIYACDLNIGKRNAMNQKNRRSPVEIQNVQAPSDQ